MKTNQFFTRINFVFKQSRRVIEDKTIFYSDDTTTLLERGYVVVVNALLTFNLGGGWQG